MVIKVVGWVYGEEDGNNRGVFKAVWVPVKVMVTSGDGVKGGAEGGDVNQISNRPVLLETPENIVI